MSTNRAMRSVVSAYLCVEELMALSCTRRRRVVFNPGKARETVLVATRVGNSAIRMHAANQYIYRRARHRGDRPMPRG